MSVPDKSDLEVLLPGREVVAKGETLVIRPLYFGQYPRAIKLIRPLATIIQETGLFRVQSEVGPDGQARAQFSASDNWLGALPVVLEQGGEALIQFFSFAIGKPRDWFDTLPGDEGFRLANAIFQENSDFFVRKIMPLLAEMGLMNMEPTITPGAPLSPSSTATGIVG